ncbi:FK506-binding protein 3-like [Chenopodium quinoa]|uniref:FK506-binding protein 3-like n=1 Tax=Chenopodium quinoa TaxID=63459 RepID=UPI000B78E1C1|nr:FK506-binding protein 3-like [Chenopodium quinoa]
MEALGSWDYIEIPEDEALELAFSNNKGIVEIIEEENEYNEEPEVSDEFEDENYEEINNIMEGEELENSESDDNEEDKSKMTIGQLKRAECLYLMADDHDPHCVEDIDDDEYEDEYEDEDEDDDEPYDVNKEDDLGEPEDQAQDKFERRLEEFEISAERAPLIENTAREIVGENPTPETHGQGQDQNNTGGGGGEKAPAQRKRRGPTRIFKKLDGPMELQVQNKKNAEMKEYVHRMGPKTFGEKRPEWVSSSLYPKVLLVASKEPSSSTITTLLEHTQELVEGKFEPSVENDPFAMALGRPYHPGRVVGSGGSLLGWKKVMGQEYTKSGRSQASVNSPGELDAKVASITEQVHNELVGEFNAWEKKMNLPTLSFLTSTLVDSCSQPKGQGEGAMIDVLLQVPTPTHADSRELDNPTPHEYPELQEDTRCALLAPGHANSTALSWVAYGSA